MDKEGVVVFVSGYFGPNRFDWTNTLFVMGIKLDPEPADVPPRLVPVLLPPRPELEVEAPVRAVLDAVPRPLAVVPVVGVVVPGVLLKGTVVDVPTDAGDVETVGVVDTEGKPLVPVWVVLEGLVPAPTVLPELLLAAVVPIAGKDVAELAG